MEKPEEDVEKGVDTLEEKHLKIIVDAIPYMKDFMQDDMTFLVHDFRTATYSVVVEGNKLKTPYKPGDPFDNNSSVLAGIKQLKQQYQALVPKGVFGVPAKGLLTPVFDEKGEMVACITVSKSIELETRIEEATGSLFSSLEQLNAGVEEVNSNSQQLSAFIKGIFDFSIQTQSKIREIDGIIQIIKSISSQSNLLALNAAIEAARAGETGRGFSVVANEMGKLSNLSKESAEKVAKSLMEMKNAIDMIGQQIGKTSMASDSQASATEEIAATVDEIVGVSKQLSDIAKIKTVEDDLKKISK